jgi:aspartate--ammonia ligase
LFVTSETGLNDDLSGIERPVSFDTSDGQQLQIVHSLAKWKRMALSKYDIKDKDGIYTDMNAIRRDEKTDRTHSYYVDQWDWEKVISREERTMDKFKETVEAIYKVLRKTDKYIVKQYSVLRTKLPSKIIYISTQALESEYPALSPSQREYEMCKRYKAVCITQVGKMLRSGKIHEKRSPDYDDWELNGDILVYNDVINTAFELSSMGIRVDKDSLIKQLKISGEEAKMQLEYHKAVIDEKLPFTIGGGIGQSRLCMFFLEKAHIGEVQSSAWSKEIKEECKEKNIKLL